MSHDLRNHHLSIEGYADILQIEYNQTRATKIQYLGQTVLRGSHGVLSQSIINGRIQWPIRF